MKHRRNIPTVFIASVLCLIFLTTPVYAYSDPNAVGLASQILTPLLIAATAGLTFLRKQAGAALGNLARRLRPRTNAKG